MKGCYSRMIIYLIFGTQALLANAVVYRNLAGPKSKIISFNYCLLIEKFGLFLCLLPADKTMQRGRFYSKVEKNSPMLARFLKWRLLMSVISALAMVDFLYYHDFRTYPPITEQLPFDSEMYRNAQNNTLNKLL